MKPISACGGLTKEQVLAFEKDHDCCWVKFGDGSGVWKALSGENLVTLTLKSVIKDESISDNESTFWVNCRPTDNEAWAVATEVHDAILGTKSIISPLNHAELLVK